MFKKAVKGSRPFRIALDGPSGSGKTYTGLLILQELCGAGGFCVFDTERGSASLYADRFDFDTLEPETHNPRVYIDAIKAAEKAGYKGILIDSLSHAWTGKDGALEQVDKAAKRSNSNNTFTAWRDVTPLHNELVDTIISAKMHVVATMRSKMEYILESITRNGKTFQQPRKVGLAPIQRDGVEYEFDLIADMDLDHNLIVSKTRFESLDGLVIQKPGADFVQKLKDWLSTTVGVSPSDKVISETTAEPVAAEAEPRQAQTPATESGGSPADDDGLISSDDWQRLIAKGQAQGWTAACVGKYTQKRFKLPPEDEQCLTMKQARMVAKVLAELTPEKAGVR